MVVMIRAGRGACADCAPHKASRCLRPFRCTTQGLAAPTFQAIFAQGLAIFSAGPACGKSHFLECDIRPDYKEYVVYQRFFGLQKFTYSSNTIERVNHCKTVQQVWSNLARSDKDSFSTSVRKYIEPINTSNVCGQLCAWMEFVLLADLLASCFSLKFYYKYWTNRGEML